MKHNRYYTGLFCIFFLFLNSSVAMSDEIKKSKDAEWDFFLQSIDPYANQDDKTKPAPQNNEQERTARVVIKPKPLPNGATPRQVSEYNQKIQKALREQQKQEADNLYETVESMGYKPEPKSTVSNKSFTLTTSNSIVKSGYSAKKVNFNWGGELYGYSYADYEFVFESTNAEHTEKMTTVMNEMAKAGWEVDLNRSFQRVDGSGSKAKAFTTTQMRFRREK
jgi:hypothetical protein